ncbi:MAG TPA: alpha/beta fold hydrolase, partial [Myxococcota bacterium]|nr:alpha/beta fold hydrolase [Myxococcota bacterium]
AAFYARAAEFYLAPGDRKKLPTYDRFVSLFDEAVPAARAARTSVPFEGKSLPAIVIPAADSAPEKHVVLLHGGFDSLMEELYDFGLALAEAGYRIVLFEGPGQGAALRKSGLAMKPDWERPVAAVLNHFAIETCTILGISLGGLLAPRAAAFEPRIARVICWDVLDEFFDCFASRSAALARTLALLSRSGARRALNALLGSAMRRDADLAWVLGHGMHVSGSRDPYEFVGWLRSLRTADFSNRITQDVLLLAGAEDHIVPVHQLLRQAAALTSARSVTTRLFTRREHAHNHCQIGNAGLALRVMTDWLDANAAAA